MRQAIAKSRLKKIYDGVASYYDAFHSWGTLRADQKGRAMVVQHAVGPGDFVLDAGGGTGSTSILAAKKVGSRGKVVVFDMSSGMLEMARQKAQQAGLSDRMSFQKGDILKLPFKDQTFDAVLSTYSLCPLGDPKAGALELYRVLKPGGRFGAAHSMEPPNPITRWFAQRFEDMAWKFPHLSLGCRPVAVLPALKNAGTKVLFESNVGLGLFYFHVFVVQK